MPRRPTGRPPGRPRHPEPLTPAEQRVLVELRQGRTNPEIAAALGLSIDTVKYHVANMLGKLGVEDRRELAAWEPEQRRVPWGFAALGRLLGGLDWRIPLAACVTGAVAAGTYAGVVAFRSDPGAPIDSTTTVASGAPLGEARPIQSSVDPLVLQPADVLEPAALGAGGAAETLRFDLATAHVSVFTHARMNDDLGPLWQPGGTLAIAVAGKSLAVFDASTGGWRETAFGVPRAGVWSAGGHHYAFYGGSIVRVIDFGSGQVQTLEVVGVPSSLSPDGRWLTLSARGDDLLVDLGLPSFAYGLPPGAGRGVTWLDTETALVWSDTVLVTVDVSSGVPLSVGQSAVAPTSPPQVASTTNWIVDSSTGDLRVLRPPGLATMATLQYARPLAWFPDGKRLLVHRQGCTPEASLAVFDVESGAVTRLAMPRAVLSAGVSPDGANVAFSNGRRVFLVPADGSGKATEIYKSGKPQVTGVRWAPDSQWLTFTLSLNWQACDA